MQNQMQQQMQPQMQPQMQQQKRKVITIIRHAESLYNDAMNTGRVLNDFELRNCRLSAAGKIQAAEGLSHSFDLLIVSPLKRAIETYAYSNIRTTDIMVSHLFREWKTSRLNMTDGEDEDKNIETHAELQQRVVEALEFLQNIPIPAVSVGSCKGGGGVDVGGGGGDDEYHIGIISHQDFIRCFFQLHTGKEISLGNCGYVPFTILH